jgi:hypothetical protein
MSDLECTQCGTGTAEPEAAKVIVVVEAGGKERRYDADGWDADEYGRLTVSRTTARSELGGTTHKVTGEYSSPNAWLSVREDGASTGDPYFRQGKKLAIALDALREIDDRFTSDDLDADLCRALDKIAAEALYEIAELDL